MPTEQLRRLVEKEDRDRRLIAAIVVMVLGGASMVYGAAVIDRYFDKYNYDIEPQKTNLAGGILLTMLGAIIVTVTIVYLLPPFRK